MTIIVVDESYLIQFCKLHYVVSSRQDLPSHDLTICLIRNSRIGPVTSSRSRDITKAQLYRDLRTLD